MKTLDKEDKEVLSVIFNRERKTHDVLDAYLCLKASMRLFHFVGR